MKFVALSDTHGFHHELELPYGDVLLHCGDVSKRGRYEEVLDFLNWFAAQPHPHKIFIAGNHDFFFEQFPPAQVASIIPEGVTYLQDSGTIIEGLLIYGSPMTPWFYNWAFNQHRGAAIRHYWDRIPPETHVLLTHGPVHGILDLTCRGEQVGCVDLLHAVERIAPRVHLCGHIHEAYGQQVVGPTTFINASVLNEHYQYCHPPVCWEWP